LDIDPFCGEYSRWRRSSRAMDRGNRKSGIGNQEIWNLEIARFLHLKAEIIKLKLDNPKVQFEVYDL